LQLFLFVLGRSSPHLPILLQFGANSWHDAVATFAPAPGERMKTAAKTRAFQEQRDAARDGAIACGKDIRRLSCARDGTRHGVKRRTVTEEVGETEKHLGMEFPPNGWSWNLDLPRKETRINLFHGNFYFLKFKI